MTGDAAGDLIGTRLGHYRVDGVLGKGGMSVLYRATDVRLGRSVALKVIGAHLGADAEFRERFVDEARNTSAIDHANIVPVYDFGELDGMLYLAMRLVDGSDLASRIDGKPMDPERALRLLEQVADALDSLHERGLVHLDMKPANVLVTGRESTREHVYIADFGLTRRGTTGHRTRGGDFLGSPTYAAPEHLRGEPLDGRTDQYALACVACTCLTGRPPFTGEVSTVIKGHLNEQPPSLSRGAGLPSAVDDAVHRGLAKAPSERYPSCGELISALRTALRATPPPASHTVRGMSPVPQAPTRPVPQQAGNQPPRPPEAHRGPSREQPPPGQAPRTPPPGTGMPPAGGAPGPQVPGRPVQGQPPGYPPPAGDPRRSPPGRGGARTAWIVGGIVAAAVVIVTVLLIVFTGGDGDSARTPETPRWSVPDGPVDSGQAGGHPSAPAFAPIEPGSWPYSPAS